VGEQRYAAFAHRSNNSFNLDEFRVEAAVDELVPIRTHWRRQVGRSEFEDSSGAYSRRELVIGIRDTFYLN